MPQQYQVPQFVDVEDKIFGPFTAKQFIMFVVAFLVIGALWVSPLPPQAVIILAVPILIFTTLLAFYKVNGRSFVWYLYAIAHFLFTGKKFLWERKADSENIYLKRQELEKEEIEKKATPGAPVKKAFNETRIQSLARILDTAGHAVNEDALAPPGFEK